MEDQHWYVESIEVIHEPGDAFVSLTVRAKKIAKSGLARGAAVERKYVLTPDRLAELGTTFLRYAERAKGQALDASPKKMH